MRYIQKPQKPQIVEAFMFPVELYISLENNNTDESPNSKVHYVPAGDYLLISNRRLEVMTKKEFAAQHDPVAMLAGDPKPKQAKPRKKRESKHGLSKAVLTQQTNGVEQGASA